MIDEKTRLLRELDDARVALWAILEDIDPSVEIYPGWNKRDFFAHIAGWEAWIFETFRDYLDGYPADRRRYASADEANAVFVAARRGSSVEAIRLECEINRFAINQFLADVPARSFRKPYRFPSGENSVAEFVESATTHERDHAREILELKQAGKL